MIGIDYKDKTFVSKNPIYIIYCEHTHQKIADFGTFSYAVAYDNSYHRRSYKNRPTVYFIAKASEINMEHAQRVDEALKLQYEDTKKNKNDDEFLSRKDNFLDEIEEGFRFINLYVVEEEARINNNPSYFRNNPEITGRVLLQNNRYIPLNKIVTPLIDYSAYSRNNWSLPKFSLFMKLDNGNEEVFKFVENNKYDPRYLYNNHTSATWLLNSDLSERLLPSKTAIRGSEDLLVLVYNKKNPRKFSYLFWMLDGDDDVIMKHSYQQRIFLRKTPKEEIDPLDIEDFQIIPYASFINNGQFSYKNT